jgi:hypothetical protein
LIASDFSQYTIDCIIEDLTNNDTFKQRDKSKPSATVRLGIILDTIDLLVYQYSLQKGSSCVKDNSPLKRD